MDPGSVTPTKPGRFVAVAHRGGNGRRALARALAAGVDWIEVDVWLHYGRLVARHDPTLWRLPVSVGKRSISVHLGPSLDLDWLIGRTASCGAFLLIDLKGRNPRLAAQIIDALRRGQAIGRAALCGQEWEPLDAARALGDDVQTLYSVGSVAQFDAFVGRRRDGSVPSITSCWHALLTEERCATLAEVGAGAVAWTVDDEARARALIGWGTYGITSNDYAMLRRLREPAEPPGDAQLAERRESGR